MPVPKGIRHQSQVLDRSICKPIFGKRSVTADGSEVTLDTLEFINAIRAHRESTGKVDLSLEEVFKILKNLGYTKK